MRIRLPRTTPALAAVLLTAVVVPLASQAAAPATATPTTTSVPVATVVPPTSMAPGPTAAPPTAPPPSAAAPSTVPATAPGTTAAPVSPALAAVVDVGAEKQPRPYDEYLAAAIADIDAWWTTEYPRLYGQPYQPLAGGIYAGYPERSSTIPGCGAGPTTTYEELANSGAFYCPIGDFMAYDDGADGILYDLATQFGPAVIATVMAHEWGHAIQSRLGAFDRDYETVITEQQADCMAGAWSRRAWDGHVPGLTFNDDDIRSGLIAMAVVADAPGTSVFEPGGHGSAFDRVGAFQHGFIGGVDNCTTMLDTPLPLLPNLFTDVDVVNQGNAPFGHGDGQIFNIVQNDLTEFWPAEVASMGVTVPLIQLRPSTGATDSCEQPSTLFTVGAVFCPATNEVIFDEERARDLYDRFGDFAVGYIIGAAWAEGVQHALGWQHTGEAKSTLADCMVGAWVQGALPPPDNHVGATTTSPIHGTRSMAISAGDLDEAVLTSIIVGDRGLQDNERGSAFEKIAYLRLGVLEGMPRCIAEAQRLAG